MPPEDFGLIAKQEAAKWGMGVGDFRAAVNARRKKFQAEEKAREKAQKKADNIERARRIREMQEDGGDPEEAPLPFARAMRRARFTISDAPTLLRYQGEWYRYVSNHWQSVIDDFVESAAWQHIEATGTAPTPKIVNAVVRALQAVSYIDQSVTPTCWLDGSGRKAVSLVVCSNGAHDLDTGESFPVTPLLFNLYALPQAYDPNAADPVEWLKSLGQIWPDDQESIDCLQEIFGLMLTGDTSFQKIFLLIGQKRSGKGTILRKLADVVGEANIASPTLGYLGETFGMASLIGSWWPLWAM
jgi:putative DNA primase/helicase